MSKRSLIVRTRKGVDSFRRCGRDFGRQPSTVEVSEDDAKRIESEPRLQVIKPPPAKKPEPQKATASSDKPSAPKKDAKK